MERLKGPPSSPQSSHYVEAPCEVRDIETWRWVPDTLKGGPMTSLL